MQQFGKFGGRAGIALTTLGLLVIGLGINGASGQLTVLAQVPYVVSGGILGLALVILGAAMLVVHGARQDRALLEAKLDRLVDALEDGRTAQARTDAPTDVSGLVVAGSSSYHRAQCRLVAGREQPDLYTPQEARAAELKACRVCRPDASHSDPARPEVTIR